MPKLLVSVIVPAFNAEHTIDATLQSARSQTYKPLEIIVVNDGSTDGTPAKIAAHAAQDPRINIVSQANSGLADARNRAIDTAAGVFIAPLDADDLWATTKIERQVAALEAAGPKAALAYNWFRQIDLDGMVRPGSPCPQIGGRVFYRHLEWNFISNGSTPLVRTDVARHIRYDPALRGCEDYFFQLQVAQEFEFACVPAFLTGYRRYPGSMSSKKEWMARAHLDMYARLATRSNDAARLIISRRCAMLRVELAQIYGRVGKPARAIHALAAAMAQDPRVAGETIFSELRRATAALPTRGSAKVAPERHFEDFSVTERDGPWKTRRSPDYIARLERLDRNS